MASASHPSTESWRSSDTYRESYAENYNDDDSDTGSVSSFDQSEDWNTGAIRETSSWKLPCTLEISEENSSDVEDTDVSNSDFENSGLPKSIGILKKLSSLILNTLSKSPMGSLLRDLVESEFFLIDGDSLLITCFLNNNLKKGQILHFFYIIEQFLHDFIQKEAKFVMVFFKDAEYLYFDFPELLALRTALILHFERNTDVTVHTEFSNCLSPEWELFLTESYPYFLVVSERGITSHQTDFLNIFILHALQKKISIVQLLGMESDVLRIYGFYASSDYSHKVFFRKHKEQLQHSLHVNIIGYLKRSLKIQSYMHIHLELDSEDIQKEVHGALTLLQNLWPNGADIRSIVCSISCAVTLKLYRRMLHDTEDDNFLWESYKTKTMKKQPTLSETADLCRMHCLSVICLQKLPLSQRAKSRIITCLWNKNLLPFLKMMKYCAFYTLKEIKRSDDWSVNFAGLPDLTDDILWRNIAYYYEIELKRGLNLDLGDTLMQEYEKLWDTVLTLAEGGDFGGHMPIRTTVRPFLIENKESFRGSNEVNHNSRLIPLKSEIVKDFAGDILSELHFLSRKDPAIQSLSTREFDEITHWHSLRPLSHDFRRILSFNNKWDDTRGRVEAEKVSEFYQIFGKMKGRKTITQKCTEENQKKQLGDKKETEKRRWKKFSVNIKKEIFKNPNVGIKKLEDFLKTCSEKSVKFTAEMVGLDTCFKFWVERCSKPGAESKDISIVIHIMKQIHMIYEKYSDQIQNTDRQKLATYLKYIGFDNLAHSLYPQVNISETEEDISKYSVHMGAARFQLTYMGPYFPREERSDPDPRVHHFIPDTWQRELLDVVDNNESAVIVAPTSSGKTYASYYCMEKILREDNEGVVVYVAPTKALVNQVVGTVCNSLTKAIPKRGAIYGVFTRDYRHDVLNCKILVTVPQCLEILLLSPHNQEWTKRMRYVIFDEVHCLGGEIGAEVWEHLLVMIRCPFLALSATISNPEYLTEWLEVTKRYWQHVDCTMEHSSPTQIALKDSKEQEGRTKKSSYSVRLVWHKERFSDLEKYVCSIKDNDFIIEHYHPCAALTVNHIKKYGIPLDLGFSPRESILLYDAMVHVWPECPRIQRLEPEQFYYFKNKLVITKADAKKYEEELKKEIIHWIVLDPSKVSEVLNYLKPQTFDSPESKNQDMFPHFVEKLNKMNKLPAIFFAFNIHTVERLASQVLLNLMKKQIFQNDPYSEKLNKNLSKKKKKSKRHQISIREIESEIRKLENTFKNVTAVTTDCTYADNTIVDNQTLNNMLYRLEVTRQGHQLRKLLRRGIGFHHGSLEYKERQVVEMLFGLKHVQVVTATSSLALGINMPCKSVVFTEDSIFLDALNFRQMAGRAGRRGEDLTGSVFFYGVPLPKIERLLRSNVPKLKGQFPLKVCLVLRLMLLVAKAEDTDDAKAKALSVLQHSLISFKQPKIQSMIKFYFIYSLQFLITEGYLNLDCIPIGYSGLVSHLHYHEPANFVFVSFLRKGLFHRLCTPIKLRGHKTFSENVMQTLVVVLAHLFGRKYFPPCVLKKKKDPPNSMVVLDDLPKDFAAVVEEYNNRIKNHFVSFFLTISKLADMRKEYQLPLSGIEFSGKECEDSELVSHLMPGTESRTAVSPFACLSNIMNQDLYDLGVMHDAMLRTINVNIRNIPFLHLDKFDSTGRKCPSNAYVFNFYTKESLSVLTLENGLNIGDAFNLIKDFTLVLQSISISLEKLCDDEDDNVVLAFKQLSQEFKEKLRRSNEES